MWQDLLRALCLLMVIEGILPFLYPARWRKLAVVLATTDDRSLRLAGLASMVIGVGLLYLTR
ncbi:DUF2065 domain-containing protein [Proteobacteria bacterium 005FR1]|nr:DUF2065 domain-containing protein [Proteobacteria bacterium 005FR1]